MNLKDIFLNQGNLYTKSVTSCESTAIRRFKAFFGVSPNICERVWLMIRNKLTSDILPKHLLWTLLFLKCYHTEHVNHAIVCCDEKTFREKVRFIIDKLSLLKEVI